MWESFSHARIAGFNAVGYRKDYAVRDLILIIRGTPAHVGPDHPFCEVRLTSWGQLKPEVSGRNRASRI